MKTFKMISLGIVQEGAVVDYPVKDGIIINQENSQQSWVLEMLLDRGYKEAFERFMESGDVSDVKVVISYPGNEPATFQVSVCGVSEIEENVSVLMSGTLKRGRRRYAEELLSELLEDGLEGDQLLERFETDMLTRPRLRVDEEEEAAEKK
ncbi:YwpF family protein [Indiicoccus explosivorum]|uniref:YwpF family protein n=1 Tax=Indiicoccus explosivorum TaxID=1917864 RepID=UPI000B4401FD|nr:YwpF family protein [Indiicoccus explosivorum]